MVYAALTQQYLHDNSLVKQFVDGYDKFVHEGLQRVVDSQNTVEPQIEGLVLKLGKIEVQRPMMTEADGSRRPVTPMEARMRDLTYSAPMFLEVTSFFNGVEKKTEKVYIGELPVMVKSKLCYLYGKGRDELVELGEDALDAGGYFIINGTEKSLMTLEDLAPNRILISKDREKGSINAKVFSTRLGFRGRCTVDRTADGKLSVSLPSYNKPLELLLVLRALGLDKDEKILESFSAYKETKNDVLLNFEFDASKNKRDALEIIGKRAAPGQPVDYQVKRAELLLDRYLLPHIGVESDSRLAKAYYLAHMAERSMLVAAKKRAPEVKDHYANKRLKITGKLMEELFKYSFQFLIKDMTYQIERANVRGRKMTLAAIVRPDALTERIKYSMATGNWVGGYTGVCQPLDRYNYASALSFIRRVTSPLAKKHPHFKARDLNGTHYGRLDPNETPEGPNAGLVKNLAVFCEVTTAAPEDGVEAFLKKQGVSLKEQAKVSVYLNGRFMGFTDNGESLAREFREKRRAGELETLANVASYARTNEVFINTDEGRARRPLLIIKRGKSMLTDAVKAKLEKGELSWSDLVKQGIIEYLDAEEEENSLVALNEKHLEKAAAKGKAERYTHLEIDPVGILGYASTQLPFPEYNSAPRVLMAAQHSKQALGLYASNYNLRSETRSHILYYPQRALLATRPAEILKTHLRPAGQNLVVAVLSYKGHNMQDAVVLNRAAVDRCLGRSAFYRTYTDEEHRYPGGQRDHFEVPPEYVQGFMGETDYAQLDENGIIAPETIAPGNAVLIGKTSPPRFLKEVSALDVETEKRREASIRVRGNEEGIVDAVMLSQSMSGNKFVKVRVRRACIPEIGDKFASRFGQKGVVALISHPEDLPFTQSGITPDLIINPHAIPGRMTAGHLLEMLGAKAACMDGKYRDGTAFTGDTQGDFEQTLRENGFDYKGTETMYDGETGDVMAAKIFVGVIYYQRLYHLASLKIHARGRGPVQMLTHQPTEGRAREGGLRLGEMERDCFIGYGAASLLKERMIDSSDKTMQLVCLDCGSTAEHDKAKNRTYCPLCESTNVDEVEMSYAFKLLLDEMKSIGIQPKLLLKDKA